MHRLIGCSNLPYLFERILQKHIEMAIIPGILPVV